MYRRKSNFTEHFLWAFFTEALDPWHTCSVQTKIINEQRYNKKAKDKSPIVILGEQDAGQESYLFKVK